jgi:hypothetical protein
MARPCLHLHVTPDPAACPVCRRLADPDPRWDGYREAMGEGARPRPAATARRVPLTLLDCRHRGAATGETRACSTCTGKKDVPLFTCGVHGGCTLSNLAAGVACCRICPDRDPAPPTHPLDDSPLPAVRSFPVRHGLYHVYPLRSASPAWQRCCAMLAARTPLFTGRRVCAAAVSAATDSADAVRAALPGWEVLEVANDPGLREARTLPLLLDALGGALDDPAAAVFFGHAKGVTRPWNAGVTCHPWAWMLHEALLDHWPAVEASLSRHPITGAFKKTGRGFKGSASAWHYSGSFFWARAASLRGKAVERQWFGAESSPGIWFSPDEAGCLFGAGRVGELDLYDMARFQKAMVEYQWWRAQQAEGVAR